MTLASHDSLTSPLLKKAGFRHAFFFRTGGVSGAPFDSLNFSSLTGDSADDVAENHRRAAAWFGIEKERLHYLRQVHGTAAKVVTADDQFETSVREEGDIVITNSAQVAAGIRTADCVPILVACRKTGWVSAIHSGWKGCEINAAAQGVTALRRQGAEDIIAAIGPHLSQDSFEVSRDVAERLIHSSPEKDIARWVGEKAYIDLRKMVEAQLIEAGLAAESIDHVEGCTFIEEDKYFSFRRDGEKSGRLLSAILGGKR
ncbi:MAG: peptidoglycan editing factor PgeF [Polyangiaceae bacterium]|nr:peptidoglycan editing factor PgeF [Polyangiaceae bacterium]